VISRLSERLALDQLQLRRLKKRKLVLKDMIAHIESQLPPDNHPAACQSAAGTWLSRQAVLGDVA